MNNLHYGAADHPYLFTSLNYVYDEANISVTATGTAAPIKIAAGGLDIISKKVLSDTYKPSASIAVPTGTSAVTDIDFSDTAGYLPSLLLPVKQQKMLQMHGIPLATPIR